MSVAQAAKDAQLVVEAVPDRLEIKSHRAFRGYRRVGLGSIGGVGSIGALKGEAPSFS